jgi:hypothetical protein
MCGHRGVFVDGGVDAMDAWRALKTIVPRSLRTVVAGMRRASGGGTRPSEPLVVPPEGPKGLAYLVGSPVLRLPLDKVRYPGGRRYTVEEHHFLQYYDGGLPALRRFYEQHQPRNVFESHLLPTPRGTMPPPIESGVPWFREPETAGSKGEGGLGPEHGVQAYGPVSEQKLMLEAARLDAVLASVRRHGFRPDLGGHPKGYFMLRRSGAWVFVIRVGLHRVAAMAHLGHGSIEAVFYPAMPRFVDEADVATWPMVRDGAMSAEEAVSIFARYFLGDEGRDEVGDPLVDPPETLVLPRGHRGSSNA